MAMKIKGDLQVCRTIDAARRVNEGLESTTMTGALTLDLHSAFWQRGSAAASQDVNLPDATTLNNGWQIVVEASGAADLDVKNDGGTSVQSVGTGTAYEFTLLDNSTANGTWHVNFLEDAGSVAATRYVSTFDATTSWGTASGGYYNIDITQTTHERGTSPIVQVFEEDGSDFFEVYLDEKKILSNGDLEMYVIESPDCRFAGKVVLI